LGQLDDLADNPLRRFCEKALGATVVGSSGSEDGGERLALAYHLERHDLSARGLVLVVAGSVFTSVRIAIVLPEAFPFSGMLAAKGLVYDCHRELKAGLAPAIPSSSHVFRGIEDPVPLRYFLDRPSTFGLLADAEDLLQAVGCEGSEPDYETHEIGGAIRERSPRGITLESLASADKPKPVKPAKAVAPKVRRKRS
jgi:hypothetical protein